MIIENAKLYQTCMPQRTKQISANLQNAFLIGCLAFLYNGHNRLGKQLTGGGKNVDEPPLEINKS